jgi:hypothetical protein
MDKERVANGLDAIGGLAKSAASDVREGRLWPGDLSGILTQIHEQLRIIGGQVGNDR